LAMCPIVPVESNKLALCNLVLYLFLLA